MAITVNFVLQRHSGARAHLPRRWSRRARPIASAQRKATLATGTFQPLDDPETIMLIDSWRDQAALDAHHASPMMATIAELREKYDLHMRVERFVTDAAGVPSQDAAFIRA